MWKYKTAGGTEETIQGWINAGHGQGQGKKFCPFFKVEDVRSRGRSHKLKGTKTGRVHHYLSDGEYYQHMLSEYDPSVVDIREQYALLPWKETQQIARMLGIKHPVYSEFKTPIVMTTDFVLTHKNESKTWHEAVSIKPRDPNKPLSKRTEELLLIERLYWQRRGVPWKLSTGEDISKRNMAINLDMLRTSMVAEELDWQMDFDAREN